MKSPKGSFWRDLFVGFVVVVVLWRTAYGAEKKTTAVVNVGVVLDLSSWAGKMSLSCINMALSDFNASHPQLNATIVLHVVDSEDDLVLTANRASELIQKSEVEAIIGPESSFQARHIIQLAEKSEVPIIWKVHSSERQIREKIEILSLNQATVFVVHMVPSLASRVFAMADELGLMSKGYAWIITEATANGLNSLPISSLSSMQGVLGVKNYVPRPHTNDWDPGFKENGTLKPIIWPGYSVQPPKGWVPFNPRKILKIAVPLNNDFKPSVLKVPNILGYCLDIFTAAVNELPYLLPHEFVWYGPSSYDNLIMEVSKGTYDGAVGDITILASRTAFVDFTSPFTEPGIAVVVRARHDSLNHAWLFLKPLTWDLWVTSFCFFVFMGFVVWILEHKNSEDFRSGSLCQQIGTSLWFSFSTMVFAQREKLTSNLARFVIAIWFFVVFVLTQSYTASLTSWLTVQQLQQPVTDMSQILRNNLSIGYQEGSYVYDTLKFLGIKNLVPYASTAELHDLFFKGGRNGGIDAVIDEIPYMKLLVARYPSIYFIGSSQYNSAGFGFAFTKGSSLVDDMSEAVLKVVQGKKINEINEKWFGKSLSFQFGSGGDGDGDGSEASSSSLDLSYFSSLFLITASVSIFALTFYFFRYFIRNQTFKLYLNNSYSATLWRRIRASATSLIFIMKDDDGREARVGVEPPVAAEPVAEASLRTDIQLPSRPRV
ncbi:glutamate receptor 2.8-like [Cucurbita pepo subsp. pepo]|uniref:glutamate receptor 2.8-like n=1 Tax=Cucurbita pepo subsp. pepo TaxID=3664 RepID=UPI000C9D7D0A|nr:glutamate receptor 2.8-like [Cucurbita pepo subsp. pepo]